MNFFKIFFILVLFAFITIVITNVYLITLKPNLVNPSSQHNDFVNQLNFALISNGLNPFDVKLRQYLNEIEVNLKDGSKSSIVIFSTLKNPFWQVSSLQNIQKLAKIRNKKINLIDLSEDHPYATLQDY